MSDKMARIVAIIVYRCFLITIAFLSSLTGQWGITLLAVLAFIMVE